MPSIISQESTYSLLLVYIYSNTELSMYHEVDNLSRLLQLSQLILRDFNLSPTKLPSLIRFLTGDQKVLGSSYVQVAAVWTYTSGA